jgi:hypothetical protein
MGIGNHSTPCPVFADNLFAWDLINSHLKTGSGLNAKKSGQVNCPSNLRKISLEGYHDRTQ